MERYKRIQIEEREEIMKELIKGKSFIEIAKIASKLNRNVSSIIREIKKQ